MIGKIRGTIDSKNPPKVNICVSDITYEIDVSMTTFYQLPQIGETTTLFTHLQIREDAHNLYGFKTDTERNMFRKLLKISGIGARTSLSILSGLDVHDFTRIIVEQDSNALVRVPGIGKKTAERMILELKEKLSSQDIESKGKSTINNEALSARIALGYKEKDARQAISKNNKNFSLSETIKDALKKLSRTN